MGVQYYDYETYRGRAYKLLLYPDNSGHMSALHRIKKRENFKDKYCGVWHILRDDQGKEIIQGHGKKHAHLLLDFPNGVYWKSLCKQLDLENRFCMPVAADIDSIGRFYKKQGYNLERGFVYLTHLNKPEAEQYTFFDLFGSPEMLDRAKKAIEQYESGLLPMRLCAFYIADWIQSQKGYITSLDFLRWVSTSPYFKAVSNPLVRMVFEEHNRIAMQKAEKAAREFREKEKFEIQTGTPRFGVVGSGARVFDLNEFIDPFADSDSDILF